MWSLSTDTLFVLSLVIIGVNSVGAIGNGLLIIGLLKGSSHFSTSSLQMLLQQGLADFFNCIASIEYDGDDH